MSTLTVWCNHGLNSEQEGWLRNATKAHQLIISDNSASLAQLAKATIAFGQPPLEQVLSSRSLRWIQVSSAGYGRYDQDSCRPILQERGVVLTKSSAVYSEPCAQQVLAYMLADSRCLPSVLSNQMGPKRWPHAETRKQCRLLRDERVVIVGFGSIGARLVEMLRPFTSSIVGVRRKIAGNEGIEMLTHNDPAVAKALAEADHVVNVLPGIDTTENYFNATRLEQIRAGARFYNVGRGTTVDQETLIGMLQSGRLAAAWLDVTSPEPLPSDHKLWTTPHCYISPHSAGGHHNEGDRLVQHFIANLKQFERNEALTDRAF